MPKAKKLPSGSWRCQVSFTENGTRVRKSVTVKDPSRAGKKECERLAAELAIVHSDRGENITVHEAVANYITVKERVLSPSTIRAYNLYLKRMDPIWSAMLPEITQSTAQLWINKLSVNYSEKYIKNVYGLFRASVEYAGGNAPSVTFPRSPHTLPHAPEDKDVRTLLEHIKGRPELYTAVILAACGGLRRGEICALKTSDSDGNRIRVSKSMVRDLYGHWHIKPTPKTDTSNRIVVLPKEIMSLVTVPIGIHPEQVSNRFRRAVRSSGVKTRFRFHDLRHYYVSVAHALGVPDAYIMEMGGWKTDAVMKRVYRDALAEVMAKEQRKMDRHFRNIIV